MSYSAEHGAPYRKPKKRGLFADRGGTGYIAQRLGYQQNRVANWAKRGVPLSDRPALAALAAERKVQLPDGFLPSWATPDAARLTPAAPSQAAPSEAAE